MLSTEWESLIECGSQEVENGKEEDPDQVNEVTEQARNFDAVGVTLRILLPEFGAGAPKIGDDNSAAQHVQAVQRGQGEINREVSAVSRHEGRKALDIGRLDVHGRAVGLSG